MRTAALALVTSLAFVTACDELAPEAPEVVEDLACGAAPGAFDPAGDVVYAASDEGCVRIERRALDDGSFVPLRLVVHVDGFSRRIDVDTDALTYEGNPDGTAVITSDDVSAAITFDVCTGAWLVDVSEGEALLPLT